jgi:predicted Zn-dependent protease
LLDRSSALDLDAAVVPKFRLDTDLFIAFLLGDYAGAVSLGRAGVEAADDRGNEVTHETFRDAVAESLALQHDGFGARAYFAEMPGPEQPSYVLFRAIAHLRMNAELEDWQAVTVSQAAVEEARGAVGNRAGGAAIDQLLPFIAFAKAKRGDIGGGEYLIGATPADCNICLRIRAKIAELRGQHARADWWFARAVHGAPSIPFAQSEWGQALLARGKPDEAITQFTIASKKSPHFADPLEGWGEALITKNQSHKALEKFAEAEKYAPNWGRLHLKWGEALAYSGKKDEAAKQFARATQLDLTPSEKSELARMAQG